MDKKESEGSSNPKSTQQSTAGKDNLSKVKRVTFILEESAINNKRVEGCYPKSCLKSTAGKDNHSEKGTGVFSNLKASSANSVSPKDQFMKMIAEVKEYMKDGHENKGLSFSIQEYSSLCKYAHHICSEGSCKEKVEFVKLMEESINDIVVRKVMPKLVLANSKRNNQILFITIVELWNKYKEVGNFLRRFTHEIPRELLSRSFDELRLSYFENMVRKKFFHESCESFIQMLHDGRVGKVQFTGPVLQKFAVFCQEIGGDGDTAYYDRFQQAVCHDFVHYILSLRQSSPDKVDMICQQEFDRFVWFLDPICIESLKEILLVPYEGSEDE